jgi:exportin-1
LTDVEEDALFKTCCDFWLWLTRQRLTTVRNCDKKLKEYAGNTPMLNLGDPSMGNPLQGIQTENDNKLLVQQKVFPTELYSQTVKSMINKMPRPEEVLIDIDEHGVPRVENMQNTENSVLYEVVKEVLCNICDLTWDTTRLVIMWKLERQMDSEFSELALSRLCWAMGTMSMKLPLTDEKQFLITIIRTLLSLCENKSGKANKAIVASNIMYIVGQFPRFLKTNWNFTLVVINKLYEFMCEPFQGVMDMACKTFLGIAKSLKIEFVVQQKKQAKNSKGGMSEVMDPPYIATVIREISDRTKNLNAFNKTIFYEAVGELISAETNKDNQMKYIQDTVSPMFSGWKELLAMANNNEGFMRSDDTLRDLSLFMVTNEKLCKAIGFNYHIFFDLLFEDLKNLYFYYSNLIINDINMNPNSATSMVTRRMRAARRDIVTFITTFVSRNPDDENGKTWFTQNYAPHLLGIIEGYQKEPENVKQPEVIELGAAIVNKLERNMGTQIIPSLLQYLLDSTLPMITADFQSYPDHRTNFFGFIKAIVDRFFECNFFGNLKK